MKKFYYLMMLSCAVLFAACEKPDVPTPPDPPTPPEDTTVVTPKTEWEIADSTYTPADYTVPSHTALKMAIHLCANKASEENLELLRQRIKELQPKQMPYNMVATFNGDPKTRMGFAWFTNDSVFDGVVQIVAKKDATEDDFKGGSVITLQGNATRTKKALRYVGQCSYIYTKADLAAGTKYFYVSHKALADNLQPGTEYSWRVGTEGYWSPIAQFRTEDAVQGEFSFLVMSDSHIMNKEYVDYARRCALAAVKTAPDARFVCFPGDFVEDGTIANSEWEWERWFEESMEPLIKKMAFVPTDGNHDDSPNIN